MEKYTRQELNEILLSKKVEDFYLCISQEIRNDFPSEEETNEMLENCKMSNETSENWAEVSDAFSQLFTGVGASDLNRLLLALSDVNHKPVIVKLDDETLYDVSTFRYIDLNKEKIVRFNNLSEFYTNENARPLLFQPDRLGGLVDEPSVTVDYDDLTALEDYEKYAFQSYDGVDLTEEFIKTIGLSKGTQRTRE